MPDKAPANKELVYFPYWRFKGMFFATTPSGVKHRYMDLSYQAVESDRFPVSVGLRSQVLKIRFVTPDSGGMFLKPTLSLEKVMQIFDSRFADPMPKPIVSQAHIGDSTSLVYSPFYLDSKKLYDAVLNRPVQERTDEIESIFQSARKPGKNLAFLPTLCPACGWDLEGERDSLVLQCKNCASAWQGGKKGLQKIPFAHIPLEEEPLLFMPFWRIQADVVGLPLASYADLVKVANLPRVVQKGWDEIGFRFWAPAFKVSPQTFLRLLTSITLVQPQGSLEGKFPNGRAHPVNLPITEAIESLKINLSAFMKPRQRMLERIESIQVRPSKFMLIYVPFVEKHHDLVHPVFQTAINKNQLKLAGNL